MSHSSIPCATAITPGATSSSTSFNKSFQSNSSHPHYANVNTLLQAMMSVPPTPMPTLPPFGVSTNYISPEESDNSDDNEEPGKNERDILQWATVSGDEMVIGEYAVEAISIQKWIMHFWDNQKLTKPIERLLRFVF
jgi:hypothetical protein